MRPEMILPGGSRVDLEDFGVAEGVARQERRPTGWRRAGLGEFGLVEEGADAC